MFANSFKVACITTQYPRPYIKKQNKVTKKKQTNKQKTTQNKTQQKNKQTKPTIFRNKQAANSYKVYPIRT